MIFEKALLYVLSGTGNTYRVGCWLQELLEKESILVEMEMIEGANPKQKMKDGTEKLMGLLFPAHGFMPPWSMIKFILALPLGKGTSAICVATRGSLVAGPLRIPGASGFATFFAALVLILKGYRIKGIFSLDMPSNFINFHWGLQPKNSQKILDKTQVRLQQLVKKLTAGKKIWFTLNNTWEAGWTVMLFWLVPIFPVIYLLYGKLFMAKMMFSNNRCVGCGLCAKSCPSEAIRMVKLGEKRHPFWTFHCENCMRCMAYCRRKAVEAGHSWAIALNMLTSVPIVLWTSVWLQQRYPWIPRIENYWGNQLLNYLYFFPAILICYRLFWYLIKLRPLNTLFTYTTLTRYFRRYHEPETKLKKMTLLAKKGKAEQEKN